MLVRSVVLASHVHAFSTRIGGTSSGRYATLNLSPKWGDEPACVERNRALFAQAGGFAWERLYTARQVHGARVLTIDGSRPPAELCQEEADALASAVPGVALGVYTADCLPILVADPHGRAGVAHAGWRGTVAGVAGALVRALVDLGARPEQLAAAVGPSICADCFEVGEEVAASFPAEVIVRRPGARPHVDLRAANRAQLVAAGLAPARIDTAPPCTCCDAARFFSFRRDGAGIGQQLSFIALS
jgi:YfiH family protein